MFIKLPQKTYDVQNVAANVTPISTFARPSNIRTLSIALFKTTILDITHQSVPYDLGDHSVLKTSATVDNTKSDVDISDRVLGLACEPICGKLFAAICPETASRPSSALELVKQDHTNTLSNTVLLIHFKPTHCAHTDVILGVP